MKKARLSDQAKEDLVQIWEYVALDNPAAADRLIQAFVGHYKSLAEYPHLGRLRAELRPGVRSFAVGNYLLFYRPSSDGIDVLRILHGARDLETLFEHEGEETFRTKKKKDQ